MIHHFLDTAQLSYIVGFLQSDGHHQSNTRNRGKITVELQAGDRPLLEMFQALFPCYSSIAERTRNTNFKTGYTSCCWALFDWETRRELEVLGVPVGRKSECVALPSWEFSPRDYYRGLIDGDGSLGLTGKGFPFVSLTTASDAIAHGFVGYVECITGRRKCANRNVRDAIFNLMVVKESAQALAHDLYMGSTLRLERKYVAYELLMTWVRPEGMAKRVPGKRWTSDQDEYLSTHSLDDAVVHLARSRTAVQMRRYRLEGRYAR